MDTQKIYSENFPHSPEQAVQAVFDAGYAEGYAAATAPEPTPEPTPTGETNA